MLSAHYGKDFGTYHGFLYFKDLCVNDKQKYEITLLLAVVSYLPNPTSPPPPPPPPPTSPVADSPDSCI